MAPGKKKKKPASNPARGFATTSLPSKPRIEAIPDPPTAVTTDLTSKNGAALDTTSTIKNLSNNVQEGANSSSNNAQLSPEEFERQLEESQLQVLVDKYSVKAKRDAARQITRLYTDRRLLRGQADTLITRKWLPPELMDEILDVITMDSRSSQPFSEAPMNQKPLSEEDLMIRLWVLQQTLDGAGFTEDNVKEVLAYILSISDKIGNVMKESVWGLEESLEWLARESSKIDLPDYDNINKKKVIAGLF